MTANSTGAAHARLAGLERLFAWKGRFEHAILQDERARKTIEHWQGAGLPQDFMTGTISLYCLAPYRAQQRREFSEKLRITPLQEDSEQLALKIKSLLRSPMAKEFVSGLIR